jgi:acetyltransferase-like isoleucine patch superfamily enzyme
MTTKFFLKMLIGNLASLIWFIPKISTLLYRINGVKIGKNIFLSKSVVIDNRYPELISISNDVFITNGVKIVAHSYKSVYQQRILKLVETKGPIYIDEGVFIGIGSIVLENTHIGKGVTIGAGSVVKGHFPDHALISGNPAKIIKIYVN